MARAEISQLHIWPKSYFIYIYSCSAIQTGDKYLRDSDRSRIIRQYDSCFQVQLLIACKSEAVPATA